MKNFSKFLAVLACLLFLFTGLARANDIDYVHVELNYRLNGEEMFKTTAIAKPGTEGILTLRHETKRPQYQLRYVVSDIGVSRKGTPVASLSVQVFEGEDGAWVLRGDPRVGIALGKPASLGGPVEFNDRGIGNYELEATITPMTLDEVEKATGSRDPQAKVCAIGSLKPSLTDDGEPPRFSWRLFGLSHAGITVAAAGAGFAGALRPGVLASVADVEHPQFGQATADASIC